MQLIGRIQGTTSDDRCTRPRKPLHIALVLALSDTRRLPARTLDIGLDGMATAVAVNLKSNAECQLTLQLPPKRPGDRPRALERVVYSVLSKGHGFTVGLQFLNPSSQARTALAEHLGL